MLEIEFSSKFSNDIKKVSKYPAFIDKEFDECLKNLRNNIPLAPKYQDHKLSKSSPRIYKGLREFHLTPDICVVYKKENGTLYVYRIGKHNNLGLTEGEFSISKNS